MSTATSPVTAASALLADQSIGLLDSLKAAPDKRLPLSAALSAPPLPGPSAVATLSVAAQQLSHWLASAEAGLGVLRSTRPLLPGPTPDAQQISGALKNGMIQSGLFYESHLAHWHVGQRDIAALRQEPQASLNPDLSSHPDPLPSLVRAQLDTLDTGQIHWQAALWPGQEIDWTLRAETTDAEDSSASQRADGSPPVRLWHSTLKLSLPALGEILVRLTLHDQHLKLALETTHADIAHLLEEQRLPLAVELAQAGTCLDALTIT